MLGRPLKNGVKKIPVHVTIDSDLVTRIKKQSKKEKISVSELMNKMLKDYEKI